ncbi:hypothetical protein LCGC14_1784160, partial [marine sediment metagenome]
MVSIEGARGIVTQQRQQLRQQQQKVDTARKQIEETRLRALSRQELQVRSLQDKLEREKQTQKLEGLKGQELKKLSPVQKDLDVARKQIDSFDVQVKAAEVVLAKQQTTKRAFDKALNVFTSKRPEAIFTLKTKEEKRFFQLLQSGKQAAIKKSIEEGKQSLVAQGIDIKDIKVITEKGELFPSKLQVITDKAVVEKTKILQPVKVSEIKKKVFLPIIKRIRKETLVIRELPPRPLVTRKITFGSPREFGKSFNKATGSTSFTIAVPIRKQNGKIFVRDFNFQFKEGKIVKIKKTGSALITEKQFLKVDKKRRDKNPGFNFGDTRIIKPVLIKKTDFDKVLDATKEFFFGETGEKFIGISPIVGTTGGRPLVTAKDFQNFLRKKGLAGKVAGEFVPTTPAEVLAFGTIGALTGGAAGPLVAKTAQVGLSGFGALTALNTDLPPERRIAGTIVAVAPFISKLRIPKGKKGQARFQALEDFFKKQDREKLSLDKVQENLRFKRVGKTIRDKTQGEKVADVRKMFDEIKKTKDPKLRKKQTEGVLKILEDTYGKKNARSVFKDFLQQEGISIQPKQKSSNVFRKFIKQEVTDIGKLKLSEVKTKIILVGSPKQKARQKSRQKQLLITTQADLLSSGQTFFQPTKQAVKLSEELKTKQKARQLLFFALVSAKKSRLKEIVKIKLAKLRKKPIPFKLPKGVKQTDLIKAIQKLGK